MCLASLVIDIRLNALRFKFFKTSGTHNFAYKSLMLLWLPLHLCVLILKGKKYGFIATNINNFCFFTFEMHFNGAALNGVALNGFTPDKIDKIVNPVKSNFFYELKHFYIILFFFMKYLWMSNISSTSLAS